MISETWVPERRYGVLPHDPVSVTTRSCITDPNERAGNRDTQELSSGIEGTKGEPMVSDLDRWTNSIHNPTPSAHPCAVGGSMSKRIQKLRPLAPVGPRCPAPIRRAA